MRVVPGKCFCSSFTCFSECSTTLCAQPPFKLVDTKQKQDEVRTNGKEETGAFGGGRDEVRANGERREGKLGGRDKPADLPDGEKSVDAGDEVFSKSSIRKPLDSSLPVPGKEKVKWLDFAGKELVEVREFESSEPDDSDEDIYMRSCGCIIQ